jgi:putative FmdB family regulatory protein
MPVYEYGCNECSHEFEKFKIMAEYDVPLSEPCPSCYKVGYIDRLISSADICDPVALGIIKPTKEFNKRLAWVKSQHAGSTIEVRD